MTVIAMLAFVVRLFAAELLRALVGWLPTAERLLG